MRIGVTGASGFIGQNLIRHLREYTDFEVCPLVGDVRNPLVVECFTCNILIHLAGANRKPDELDLLDTNVLGTYNVARHCLKKGIRLLVAGSTKTDGLYGASKGIAKSIVQNLSKQGLDGGFLSLCNVFGPHCKPHYNSFLSTILWSMANDAPYEHLIKDRHQRLEIIHVSDVCQNIEGLCRSPTFRAFGPVIDFCGATEFFITIDDFVRVACDERPTRSDLRQRDITLIRQTLDWYHAHATDH